jgi:osmotically inducible protein OsmC
MPVRSADAEWQGTLQEGSGHMRFGSGAYDGAYSFASRFQDGTGTNPEELIGAAHAGCFSMAFAGALGRSGFTPTRVATTAEITLEKVGEAFRITKSLLRMEAEVPDIDEAKFKEIAEGAKANCPVSQALAGVEISLDAKLT